MTLSFEKIIEKSGDSILCDYSFSNGQLKIVLELDELDQYLYLNIKTTTIYCERVSIVSGVEKNCRIETLKLDDFLPTENGFYVPSKTFSGLMKEFKQGLNLAFGFRSSDKKYLLNLVGYSRLLSCIMESYEDIDWRLSKDLPEAL